MIFCRLQFTILILATQYRWIYVTEATGSQTRRRRRHCIERSGIAGERKQKWPNIIIFGRAAKKIVWIDEKNPNDPSRCSSRFFEDLFVPTISLQQQYMNKLSKTNNVSLLKPHICARMRSNATSVTKWIYYHVWKQCGNVTYYRALYWVGILIILTAWQVHVHKQSGFLDVHFLQVI